MSKDKIMPSFCQQTMQVSSKINTCLEKNLYTQVWRLNMPTSVGQTAPRLTCDQVVAGLIPARSVNILLLRLIMKYFLQAFSPFHLFKRDSCQFLTKEYAQVLVNCIED